MKNALLLTITALIFIGLFMFRNSVLIKESGDVIVYSRITGNAFIVYSKQPIESKPEELVELPENELKKLRLSATFQSDRVFAMVYNPTQYYICKAVFRLTPESTTSPKLESRDYQANCLVQSLSQDQIQFNYYFDNGAMGNPKIEIVKAYYCRQ